MNVLKKADVCTLFLNDKKELCTAISLLRDLQHVSGLELNTSKCEGLWLGRDKYKQEKCTLFGIKWPKQIRCLGIYVGHSKEKNDKQNWTSKMELLMNAGYIYESRYANHKQSFTNRTLQNATELSKYIYGN